MAKEKEDLAKREPIINNRIRLYREEKGYRQDDLALLLGTTSFQISRWERGLVVPKLYHVIGLEVACCRLVDDIYRPLFDEWKEKIKERAKLLDSPDKKVEKLKK